MERRVVVGLVGIALAAFTETSHAQAPSARDPSAGHSVGLSPIPSIGESINNTTVISSVVPPAPSSPPSSPFGAFPDPTLPRVPVPRSPVGMAPIDPIARSINRGHGLGLLSAFFGKSADRPPTAILRVPPRVEPTSSLEKQVIPSIWSDSPMARPGSGRPAPFAKVKPDAPRPQADPAVAPAARSAPYADDRRSTPRPRSTSTTTPAYRPAEIPAPLPEPVAPPPTVEPSNPAPVPVPVPTPTSPEPLPASAPAELPGLPNPTPPGIEPGPLPIPEPAPSTAPDLGPPVVEAAPPVVAPPSTAPAVATSTSRVDPAVTRTSRDEVALKTGPVKARPLPYATIRAAAVGDEIITINELASAVNEQLRQLTANQPTPPSDAELFQLKNQVASSILSGMIDQALVVQQARKKMKANPKAKEAFDEIIEREWNSQELPPLLRKTTSTNVHELKIKLAAEGKSYESMKEAYRKKMMFQEFLRAEIHNKVNADLHDMKVYYDDHLDKFDQPARMTWREIEIDTDRFPSRAAAYKKAEEALARLLHDEDFAAVARSMSTGPTASKGGLYVDMQPGSYGIPVVNDELNRIPTGQVSKILEAPTSFHIIRVDARREKGPLRFDEVQDKIRGMVLEQNYRKAVEEYLAKLRARTLIRTMFDNTESDPEIARRQMAGSR